MIDVSHPDSAEFSLRFAHADGHKQSHDIHSKNKPEPSGEADDGEEAAWLQSVQAAGSGEVQGLDSGNLVMDVGQLRDVPVQSAAARSLKGKLPR